MRLSKPPFYSLRAPESTASRLWENHTGVPASRHVSKGFPSLSEPQGSEEEGKPFVTCAHPFFTFSRDALGEGLLYTFFD